MKNKIQKEARGPRKRLLNNAMKNISHASGGIGLGYEIKITEKTHMRANAKIPASRKTASFRQAFPVLSFRLKKKPFFVFSIGMK